MNARARIPMSFEEYLRWEARQQEKHEYVRGEPVLRRLRSMAGGTLRHIDIVMNIATWLRTRLRGRPCKAFVADLKVKSPTGNARYPDVLVDCGTPPDSLVAMAPTAVIEVLSPSNDGKEMRERLDDYQAIPSLTFVAFVDYRRPAARIWRRQEGGWTTETVEGMEARLDLPGLGLSMPLAEAYLDVDLPPDFG